MGVGVGGGGSTCEEVAGSTVDERNTRTLQTSSIGGSVNRHEEILPNLSTISGENSSLKKELCCVCTMRESQLCSSMLYRVNQ